MLFFAFEDIDSQSRTAPDQLSMLALTEISRANRQIRMYCGVNGRF